MVDINFFWGNRMKNQGKALFGAVAVALVGHASAATTWTWTASPNDTSPNVISASVAGVGAVTATPTGWADTGTGTPRVIEQQVGTGSSSTTHFVTYSGGLGINNLDGCTSGGSCDVGDTYVSAPEHAIDNNQRYEMVMLQFSTAVNLSSLNLGYVGGTDADFTVMAFQGAAGKQALAGKAWNALDAGWKLVGNYENTTTGEKNISNSYYSSFWLVGAYNPMVGGGTGDATNDYFKLKSVTGCALGATTIDCKPRGGSAPEPGTLLLMGVGLVGLLRLRGVRTL